MPSITSKISEITASYPQFIFEQTDVFSWQPSENIIRYNPKDDQALLLLIHEIAHALLNHKQYGSDIGLIKIEQETWNCTIELAKRHNITVSAELIQSNLDSYRDWMHERSKCPRCKSTGLQIRQATYTCPACNHQWKVNQAKKCRLRRQNIKNAQ